MTNKFFSKTVKKSTLWAVVTAILIAAAIVICAVFGLNKDATLQDKKTLTLSVDKYSYDKHSALIIEEAEKQFGALDAKYIVKGDMSGDVSEIIFVFAKDAKIDSVKTAVAARFSDITKDGATGKLAGADISVSAATEKTAAILAKGFVLRGVIAGVVFAVLAFGYIALRNKNIADGLWVGGSAAIAMVLTAALVILTRVPVTTSVASVIAVAGLLTAAVVTLTLARVSSAKKEGATEESALLSVIPVKENIFLFGGLCIAVWAAGAVGGTTGIWFALSATLALLAAAFVTLLAAPAAYLSLKKIEGALSVKKGYVGAKKSSTKVKKPRVKKAEEVALVEETAENVEEVVEENAAEETSDEEA